MMKSTLLRFALFSSASNAIIGVQLAFWPLFLASRGLDATEIGVLAGVAVWVRAGTSPLIGMAADLHGDRRRVMAILAAVSLACYALFVPAYGLLALLPIATVSSICFSALLPLGENAVLEADIDYGRVRIWGSLAFVAMTLLIGRLLVTAPPDRLLVLLLGAGSLLLLAIWLLPAGRRPVHHGAHPAWRLLLRPRHGCFVLAAALIQSSHAVYYGFSALYWRSLGYDTDTIGWLWVEGVVAEIILFYWNRPLLGRLQPSHLLALGGIAGVIRWTVLGIATSLTALIAVNFLHGLTFAAAHLGAMFYLQRNAPAAQAGTAQSLYSACLSIGFGLVSLLSGALYEAAGGRAFLAMAALAALGAAVAALLSLLRPATNC